MLKIIQRISLTHIILLGFVLRILMYCAIGSWNPDVEKNRILIRDAKGYETLAENLLHYHTYRGVYDTAKISSDSNIIKAAFLPVNYDTFRVPGYPAFLACVYYISGIKPYIAIFIQLLLNIFSLVLIYRITLLLFNIKEVAIIAGLLFAIDIHSIFVSNLLVSETFFIFLFLISLLYFISGLKKKSLADFIVSAIFIAFASLTRPVALLFPFVYIIIVFIFNKGLWKWVLKTGMTYILISSALVGTFIFRNHNSYARWSLSTQDGYNLLMCNVAFTESRKSHFAVENVILNLESKCDSLGCLKMRNPFDRSAVCRKVALHYIRKNIVPYTETQVWGATHMFLSLGNIDMARKLGWNSSDVDGQINMDTQRLKQNFSHKKEALLGILTILLLVIQYAGALFGMFFLIRNHQYFILVFSVSTLLYFSVITGAIGMYRLKLPMQVVICSVAGYGYFSLKRKKIEL